MLILADADNHERFHELACLCCCGQSHRRKAGQGRGRAGGPFAKTAWRTCSFTLMRAVTNSSRNKSILCRSGQSHREETRNGIRQRGGMGGAGQGRRLTEKEETGVGALSRTAWRTCSFLLMLTITNSLMNWLVCAAVGSHTGGRPDRGGGRREGLGGGGRGPRGPWIGWRGETGEKKVRGEQRGVANMHHKRVSFLHLGCREED